MAAVVQALNLSKVYHLGDERVYALNDVSLEVYSGELVAIDGTEGSGKSTLLHTLASLRKPDSGTVRIEEFDLTQMFLSRPWGGETGCAAKGQRRPFNLWGWRTT